MLWYFSQEHPDVFSTSFSKCLNIFAALALLLILTSTCFAEEIAWIDGRLPPGSTAEGSWLWNEAVKQDEMSSHTDAQEEGLKIHSFTTEKTVMLDKDSKIFQYIFIDPKARPSGIMMKLFLDSEELSLYWENDEEAFVHLNEYITAWYMGPIPAAAQWIGLEIDCKEFDIEPTGLKGISFITNNGKLWWGKTVIKTGGENV